MTQTLPELDVPGPLPEQLGQLPEQPADPPAPDLDAAAAAAQPDQFAGVPGDAIGGPLDAADVLDWLAPAIHVIRGKLADNSAGGFLVTAADRQRHAEVSRLVAEIASILSERD